MLLGGAAYAAVELPRNSVGTEEIKRDGVTKPDIAADAVGPKEIRTGAVQTGDVKDFSLRCKDFRPAAAVCGAQAAGFTTTTVRTKIETIEMTCDQNQNCSGEETVRADCAPGEVATGGFANDEGEVVRGPDSTVARSGLSVIEQEAEPIVGTPTAWVADVQATGSGYSGSSAPAPTPRDLDLIVQVICAS